MDLNNVLIGFLFQFSGIRFWITCMNAPLPVSVLPTLPEPVLLLVSLLFGVMALFAHLFYWFAALAIIPDVYRSSPLGTLCARLVFLADIIFNFGNFLYFQRTFSYFLLPFLLFVPPTLLILTAGLGVQEEVHEGKTPKRYGSI